MLEQLLAIIRNTFFESIRQPIMLVILIIATIALILCNPLAAFTMSDDQRMLIDMGLATVFLCGALLAAFLATNVLTREIDNFTALTVISKPVGRPLFVIGKFIGVAAAILVGTLYMSFCFMLVEMHTVLQTVRDPVHVPVIVFGVGAVVLGLAGATWANYFYNKVFGSTLICITAPLAAIAYLLALMFDPDFKIQPISADFKGQIWLALVVLQMAILVLSAIAVALSTRLSQVMTLVFTLGFFMAGMLSDWLFGRRMQNLRETWLDRASEQGLTEQVQYTPPTIQLTNGYETEPVTQVVERVVDSQSLMDMATFSEQMSYGLYKIGYSILPNFQLMLLTDSLTQQHVIPTSYVMQALMYGSLYILVALCLGIILFQRREVG